MDEEFVDTSFQIASEYVFTTRLTDGGDFELDALGNLVRDTTPASRCRVRLTAARAGWAHDLALGSRFATADTIREAKRRALQWATEALKPLLDEGAITSVAVPEVDSNDIAGEFDARIEIGLPTSVPLSIVGTFKVAP
jgi:phage gp46-like protein